MSGKFGGRAGERLGVGPAGDGSGLAGWLGVAVAASEGPGVGAGLGVEVGPGVGLVVGVGVAIAAVVGVGEGPSVPKCASRSGPASQALTSATSPTSSATAG